MENEFGSIEEAKQSIIDEFGLFDMIGNVWEWTQDRYSTHSTKEVRDPTGPEKGRKRVVKGGNWADSLTQNRSAARYAFKHNKKYSNVGFRVVMTAD